MRRIFKKCVLKLKTFKEKNLDIDHVITFSFYSLPLSIKAAITYFRFMKFGMSKFIRRRELSTQQMPSVSSSAETELADWLFVLSPYQITTDRF